MQVQLGPIVAAVEAGALNPVTVPPQQALVTGAVVGQDANIAWAFTLIEGRLALDWAGAKSAFIDMRNTTLWSAQGGYSAAVPLIAEAPFTAAQQPLVINQNGSPAIARTFRQYYMQRAAADGGLEASGEAAAAEAGGGGSGAAAAGGGGGGGGSSRGKTIGAVVGTLAGVAILSALFIASMYRAKCVFAWSCASDTPLYCSRWQRVCAALEMACSRTRWEPCSLTAHMRAAPCAAVLLVEGWLVHRRRKRRAAATPSALSLDGKDAFQRRALSGGAAARVRSTGRDAKYVPSSRSLRNGMTSPASPRSGADDGGGGGGGIGKTALSADPPSSSLVPAGAGALHGSRDSSSVDERPSGAVAGARNCCMLGWGTLDWCTRSAPLRVFRHLRP